MKNKELDNIFEALGNQHRRDIVHCLGLQPHSITQLAHQENLSLPAIHKHIKVLKTSGLIRSKKIGRTNFLILNRECVKNIQVWLNEFQAYWGTDAESLENYAHYLMENDK